MITYQNNTANQSMYVTLDEGRQFLPDYTHYLLVITHEENSTTGNVLYQVPVIVNENSRVTILRFTTVGITLSGTYRYDVYGQNSSTNLNPLDESVVGVVEIGWLKLEDNTSAYLVPDITIDNDIIYNG